MKNLFLIPTPAETRIAVKSDGTLFLTNHSYPNSPNFANHNIYITNDEKIKVGDWVLWFGKHNQPFIKKVTDERNGEWLLSSTYDMWVEKDKPQKIILTTDQDLIKDGIQPIPDEFLEWLVLNPTCEEVEVNEKSSKEIQIELGTWGHDEGLLASELQEWLENGGQLYKITIPKEDEGEFCHYSGLPSPAAYVEKSIDDGWLSPMQRFKLREDKPNVILVGSGLPPAKLTLELTQKEARALLNCLSRTFAKGTDLDFTEPIEEKLLEFLKPLEK